MGLLGWAHPCQADSAAGSAPQLQIMPFADLPGAAIGPAPQEQGTLSPQIADITNGPTPQPPGTPLAQGESVSPEIWAIHGQTTFTEQYHPAFTSPFQGTNSLNRGSVGDETFDATLYLGYRPWNGAEIWINPEVDQGFGLSNSTGVAGYLSGEAYKVGWPTPYYRMPRTFFRQTIDLGGETEKVDPDLNQLGGTQTANRVVITVGKYAVVDIFDTNTYAHDPRNDFFNWALVDGGAFDYAADAWGYTYGASVEWYQDWWTIRAGIFDLSIQPNDKYLDNRLFGQFQTMVELEERHTLFNQPGKVKLLFWLTRGELGTYSDALALAAATGTVPSTSNVERYRSKTGWVLNIEQQLTKGLGFFARASITQPDVQEDDFTDISESISAGFSLQGTRWGRPDDTVGLGGVVNQISHQGKLYFGAGGIGGIIGDGQLPEAGPEQIIEAYYRLAIWKFAQITADYQFVNNPAYDRARGPVSVLGLRLHMQF